MERPIEDGMRVLLIEDNEDVAGLLRESLQKAETGIELEHAARLDSGLERAAEGGIDAVLLDLDLPDSKGLSTLVKALADAPRMPIVVMTGHNDESMALRAVREGAQDYLFKGQASPMLLSRVLRYAVERKRLEQLHEDLLHNINHELKSPIASIFATMAALSEGMVGELTEAQANWVGLAVKNAQHLLNLVDDLLDVARAQTGALTVEPTSIDLREVVTETVSSLKPVAEKREVALAEEVSGSLPPVLADPKRARQVLGNLVDNAIKFSPLGGSISVRAEEVSGKAGFVRVAVADSGCGIEPEDTERVFDRLYRASKKKPAAQKGLGIGLFLCKQLVDLHGGEIWVESSLGKGSTFFFTLPVYSLEK
ncbi:MAG: hybrid sensor histidine kinase/response regulator [Elusimicrobiota bacterium]